jgi:hypothetical protein
MCTLAFPDYKRTLIGGEPAIRLLRGWQSNITVTLEDKSAIGRYKNTDYRRDKYVWLQYIAKG